MRRMLPDLKTVGHIFKRLMNTNRPSMVALCSDLPPWIPCVEFLSKRFSTELNDIASGCPVSAIAPWDLLTESEFRCCLSPSSNSVHFRHGFIFVMQKDFYGLLLARMQTLAFPLESQIETGSLATCTYRWSLGGLDCWSGSANKMKVY